MRQTLLSRHSFNTGIFANIVSTGVLAICGLAINYLINKFYGTAGLGLFNLVMALFIVFSQFSTFGLHYSMIKYTAENHNKKNELKKILSSGLLLSLSISSLVIALCFIFSFFIDNIFKFQYLAEAWIITIPGIIFFSLNKSFFAFMNGKNYMLAFSGVTSLRYVSSLSVLLILIYNNSHLYKLGYIITISEMIVFVTCLWIFWGKITWSLSLSSWYKKHFIFGAKSFLAGASIELNSRVDVLILSYFTNELCVGIYSFAFFVVEGLLQLIVVVRNSLNPLITRYFYSQEYDILENKIREVCFLFFITMFFLLLISTFFYYAYLCFVLQNNFSESMYVFLILITGLLFSTYYLPLQFFPNHVGKPSHQSYVNFIILSINILLNTFFSYKYGLYGAAIATALSFSLTAFITRQYIIMFLKNARLTLCTDQPTESNLAVPHW